MREDVANFIKDLSQRDFTVFAGAGIAKPTGIPNWKGLLKALADEQPIKGVVIDDVIGYLYPEVAQMLFSLYEINGKIDDYYRIIKQKLESQAASHVPLQRKLIQVGGSIITTNLDSTFEAAFKEEGKTARRYGHLEKGYKIQCLPDLNIENAKRRDFITYLHGRYDKNDIIIKTADYEKYYSSINEGDDRSVVERFLRYIYEEQTLVFIGFSFSDRYLNKLLEKISKEINRKSIEESKVEMQSMDKRKRHYALLQDINFGNNSYLLNNINNFKQESKEFKKAIRLQQSIKLEKWLERMNIKVVKYEYEKHKQMEDWFGNIAEKREMREGAWVDYSRKKDIGTDMLRLG